MLVVPARPRRARAVNFGGIVYRNFRSPKSLASMRIAAAGKAAGDDPEGMVNAVRDWLTDAFGPQDGPVVFGRLFDPEDDLDLDSVTDLIAKTLEIGGGVGTANPTG